MHDGVESPVDDALVRALLVEQHPDLAELPVSLFAAGWDNAIYRLGDELAVRIPLREMSAPLVANEQDWLAVLAPDLPVPVPAPVRRGEPGCGYPWRWSVVPWITGEVVVEPTPERQEQMALDLADFLLALHQPAPANAPVNPYRGNPLADRDELTRERLVAAAPKIDELGIDRSAVAAVWEEALAVGAWAGPQMWLHGDLHSLNVLWRDHRLAAVIDFGDITSGDPACDLLGFCYLFDRPARTAAYNHLIERSEIFDDNMWARGRGWAIIHSLAVLANDFGIESLNTAAARALQATAAPPQQPG